MSAAGDFIVIDAEITRIKLRLKNAPDDPALKEKMGVLLNAREKLLTNIRRKGRATTAHERL
jgi:hypothetical protein